jgi:outer membrane protein TolC
MANLFQGRRRLNTQILSGAVIISLLPWSGASAQHEPAPFQPAGAAASVPPAPLTLPEALRIALEQQPALTAHRASLASAQTAYDGLQKLHLTGLLSRDLPIRRRQACLGVRIAEAGLDQAEWETMYAVTRTYFGVVYARDQLRVAQDVAESLKFYEDRVRDLVKKGESREWTTSTVDKITAYQRLAQTKQADATRGIERATAALKEAMGVAPELPVQIGDDQLPSPRVEVNREQIVALALVRRGELVQANTAAEVVELEVKAQGTTCLPTARTFAAGADIHARPVPQGIANSEYRPGAISLEMPTLFAGPRSSRVARARDLSGRAAAVVEKTRNLVVLDADDAYLRWAEWAHKVPQTRDAAQAGSRLAKTTREDFRASQKVRIDDILANEVLAGQAQSSYNEALYQQLISLAGLQRVTAGGFDAGFGNPRSPRP